MELIQTIEQDMKTAMKAKDSAKLETLRMMRGEYTTMQKTGVEPTETAFLTRLQKMSKLRQETAAVYNSALRYDLAAKETQEASIIDGYLPKQMIEEDVVTLVITTARANALVISKENMGKLVKLTVEASGGTTNGKIVSGVVNRLIASEAV